MAKSKEGFCGICGATTRFVIVSAYRSGNLPFVDGRNYDEVCDCCHAAWKTSEWDQKTGKFINFHPYNNPHFYAPEELMKEGWSKEQAKLSIKCIKRALKNAKPLK